MALIRSQFLVLMLLIVTATAKSTSQQFPATAPTQDRDALIALYKATKGENWDESTGWKEAPTLGDGFNDDPCSPPVWFGLICDAQPRVQVVNLRGNGLQGEIPSDLGDLTALGNLTLSSNSLTGTIPPQLGSLPFLRVLALSANGLSGTIPLQLANLTTLESLSLSSNRLVGEIPPQLSNLGSLEDLLLGSNQLTGSIPPDLEELTSLDFLSLPNNQLTGPIPPGLGNLPNMRTLDLHSNRLSGPIPPELANLANLRVAILSDNHLTGTIPPLLGTLQSLVKLDLEKNHLTGPVPSEIARLGEDVLDIRDNRLDSVEGGLDAELNVAQKGDALWNSQQSLSAVYPQLAIGGGFDVVLMISSRTTQAWTGRVYLDGGLWPSDRSWQLDGQDMTGQTSFAVNLDPQATHRFVLSSSADAAVDGWMALRAEADSRPQDVAAAFFYNLSGDAGLSDSTGVSPAQLGRSFFFPVERSTTQASVLTGLALRSLVGTVFLDLYDAQGEYVLDVRVPEDGALLVSEAFPDLPADFVGSIVASSGSGSFFLTVVRVEVTEASGIQLTSVPATVTP